MASPARETALRCLLTWEGHGAWIDGILPHAIQRAGLHSRDAALCTRLVYGVVQHQMLLDWHLDRLSSVPVENMDASVRNCLRMGLYQLLFLDRVPAHAAVSESVSLVRPFNRGKKAAGLINAVLRTVQREMETDHVPEPEDLSIRYSCPTWLVKEFSRILPPSEWEAFLSSVNVQCPVVAQVNTRKTTAQALSEELCAAGVSVLAHPWLPDCLELTDTGALEALPAFREGRFYVQDAAAKLSVLAAAPEPGMNVLDACAAPGGKSFSASLLMEECGNIFSCDIHPRKCGFIKDGAARLGLSNITVSTADARQFNPALEARFDRVIADVPCSGLGVIRKKPDIRYKDPAPLEGLPGIQRAILNNVSRYVRPGGILLYATCTLLPRENEGVVTSFLQEREDFFLESVSLPGPVGKIAGMVTLWPHRHGTDGFFFARLRRRERGYTVD